MRGKHVPTVFVLIAVAVSLVVLVLTASMRAADVQWAYVHMAVAAATALFVAFVGIRQCRALLDKGASASAVASSNAFYMGIVWAWGALALVATYATGADAVSAGLMWPEARTQLGNKAAVIEQPRGRGHVVAFVEDPNFRAFMEGTELLFINAVLLGPAH